MGKMNPIRWIKTEYICWKAAIKSYKQSEESKKLMRIIYDYQEKYGFKAGSFIAAVAFFIATFEVVSYKYLDLWFALLLAYVIYKIAL